MPSPIWLIEARGGDLAQVPQQLMDAIEQMGMEVIPAAAGMKRRGGGIGRNA